MPSRHSLAWFLVIPSITQDYPYHLAVFAAQHPAFLRTMKNRGLDGVTPENGENRALSLDTAPLGGLPVWVRHDLREGSTVTSVLMQNCPRCLETSQAIVKHSYYSAGYMCYRARCLTMAASP